jgi:hypothetical protein
MVRARFELAVSRFNKGKWDCKLPSLARRLAETESIAKAEENAQTT